MGSGGEKKEEVDTDLQTGSAGPTEKGLNQPSLHPTPRPHCIFALLRAACSTAPECLCY